MDPKWIQTADGRFTASLVEPGPSGVRFDPFWLVEGPEDFEAVNVGSLEEARDLLARLARRRTYPKVSARGSVRPATLALGRACDGSGVRVPLSSAEALRRAVTCRDCHRTFTVRIGKDKHGWPAATLPQHKVSTVGVVR